MADRLKHIWPPLLIGVTFLAGWQLLVVSQGIEPYVLPAPSLIGENFFSDIGKMWETAFYTGTTAILGLVFGTILGIAMALVAQRFVLVNNLITPLAAGLAAVPIIALTPVLNNMFSITSRTPRVLVTMIIVFFPMLVNVTRGLIQVQPVQLELMRSMNAQPRTVLRVLRIPNAIPFFFTGLKIAAVGVMAGAITGEFLGGGKGFGELIRVAASNLNTPRVFSLILYLSLVGLALYAFVTWVQRTFVFWHKDQVIRGTD